MTHQLPTEWSAQVPVPLGSPSCCNSLDKDSPSTLCLAALERMKLSTATVAFTSPDSEGTHGWGRGCHCGPSHLLAALLSSAQSPQASLSQEHCYCWQKTLGAELSTSFFLDFFADTGGSGWAAGKRGLCARSWAEYPELPKGRWTQWGTHQTWRQQ